MSDAIDDFVAATGQAGDRAVVSVAAPAWALGLLVWGRIRPGDEAIDVSGDASVLDKLLGASLVP